MGRDAERADLAQHEEHDVLERERAEEPGRGEDERYKRQPSLFAVGDPDEQKPRADRGEERHSEHRGRDVGLGPGPLEDNLAVPGGDNLVTTEPGGRLADTAEHGIAADLGNHVMLQKDPADHSPGDGNENGRDCQCELGCGCLHL